MRVSLLPREQDEVVDGGGPPRVPPREHELACAAAEPLVAAWQHDPWRPRAEPAPQLPDQVHYLVDVHRNAVVGAKPLPLAVLESGQLPLVLRPGQAHGRVGVEVAAGEAREQERRRGHAEHGRQRAEDRDRPDAEVGDHLEVERVLPRGSDLVDGEELAGRLLHGEEHGDPALDAVVLPQPGSDGAGEGVHARLADVRKPQPRGVEPRAGAPHAQHGDPAPVARRQERHLSVDVVDGVEHKVGAAPKVRLLRVGIKHLDPWVELRLRADPAEVPLEARRLWKPDVRARGHRVPVEGRQGHLVEVDKTQLSHTRSQ
mmetsp:Transcript_6371/g.15308  ORF Transcript_6371/g.15308 Transcript_6371/m.15308 type:complete len:316 (-) Transcript_6371:395-1342(-)